LCANGVIHQRILRLRLPTKVDAQKALHGICVTSRFLLSAPLQHLSDICDDPDTVVTADG
jgi:hypothetical protein